MRSLVLFLFLIVVSSGGLLAQDQESFETISVENADELIEIRTWTDGNGAFVAATFSPDGSELAIALNNGQIEIMSMQTMQTQLVIEGVEIEAEWLTYGSDGTELLLSNRTGTYTLVNTDTGEILTVNPITEDEYEFSPTFDVRKYALWSYSRPGVSIHDTITGDELLTVEDADIWRVSYDGELLLTRNPEYVVQIWDIVSGEMIFRIAPPSANTFRDGLSEAGFTPEGLVWTTYPQFVEADDGDFWSNPIQFWDVSTGEIVFELGDDYGQYVAVRSLVFDPTYSYVLAYVLAERGGDQCLIWNLVSREELLCPVGGNYNAAFSASGALLANYSGTGSGVAIRQVEPPGRPITVLDAEGTWYAEFSSDGKFLVTIDHDIHLWGIRDSDG